MEQPIKVAHLLGSLNRGGTETLFLNMINHADDCQFEMIGICRQGGELYNSFISSGIPIFKLSPGSRWQIGLYLIRLRRLLIKNQVSVIHAHQSLDTIYGYCASKGLGIIIVQTIHGFDFDNGFIGKILKWLSFKTADKSVFVSNTQKNKYISDYNLNPLKTTVVHNGIDLEKFTSRRNFLIRDELGIDNRKLLLGMVGNFSPGRDHMTVVRFLSKLNCIGIDFSFVFIGGKIESHLGLYEECHNYCIDNGLKDKVFFLGSRSDVCELLPQLDAFIYSTRHDAFGISLIEAIAAGIPVFVNDWEVMKEVTENGVRAIIYRSEDEQDLLVKLMNFCTDKEYFRERAQKNAEWAKGKYHIQQHIYQLNQLYSALNS